MSFAVAKYGPARQVVKETNLFFALPALLALLPRSPVLVLSRSPVGVASSFVRGDLFRRWGYRSRYQQMVTMTRHGNGSTRRFAALVPDDNPADLVALVRLHVLNTVLLADSLAGRSPAHISYETAVTKRGDALATLSGIAPELEGPGLPGETAPDPPRPRTAGDQTFATTNHKTALAAGLEPADAALIRATAAASLAAAQALVPAPVAARAASWLAGDHLYRLEAPRPRTATARPATPPALPSAAARYVRRGTLEVRNVLVSNAEYARFLNALSKSGLPNSHHGTYLLACEMPHERGGRLHQDHASGRWTVSRGYEGYPAYWVTWIGAASLRRLDRRAAARTGRTNPADPRRSHHRQRRLPVRRRHPGNRTGPSRQHGASPARQPASMVQRRPSRSDGICRRGSPVAARDRMEHPGNPAGRAAAPLPAYPRAAPAASASAWSATPASRRPSLPANWPHG